MTTVMTKMTKPIWRKYKNNFNNHESQKQEKIQFSYIQCLCNVLLRKPVVLPRF